MKKITLGRDLVLDHNLREPEFLAAFPEIQSRPRKAHEYYLGPVMIGGREFHATLCFEDEVISSATLVCVTMRHGKQVSYDFDNERKIDSKNAEWIKNYFKQKPPVEACRLSVKHGFEQKSGFSSIVITFPRASTLPLRRLLRLFGRLV